MSSYTWYAPLKSQITRKTFWKSYLAFFWKVDLPELTRRARSTEGAIVTTPSLVIACRQNWVSKNVLARAVNNWSDRIAQLDQTSCALTHGNSEVLSRSYQSTVWSMVWSILRRCSQFQDIQKLYLDAALWAVLEHFEAVWRISRDQKKLEKSISKDFWNFVFFSSNFPSTSFFLFFVLNLPKKGPKRGNPIKSLNFFVFCSSPYWNVSKVGHFANFLKFSFGGMLSRARAW